MSTQNGSSDIAITISRKMLGWTIASVLVAIVGIVISILYTKEIDVNNAYHTRVDQITKTKGDADEYLNVIHVAIVNAGLMIDLLEKNNTAQIILKYPEYQRRRDTVWTIEDKCKNFLFLHYKDNDSTLTKNVAELSRRIRKLHGQEIYQLCEKSKQARIKKSDLEGAHKSYQKIVLLWHETQNELNDRHNKQIEATKSKYEAYLLPFIGKL